MMNDRELLELAAKAAGIEHRPDSGYRVTGTGVTGIPIFEKWNPLTDDGDALRIAVDLSFDLHINAGHVEVFSGELDDCIIQPCKDTDTRAATRRAIVRAAAAIGEAMP